MKKLFLVIVVLLTATMSFAQNTLVATLTHGENITAYYGVYALRDALEAATNGDVINLSGGQFESSWFTINKAVTLRGAGIDAANPTLLKGINISIPTENSNRFSMEGIKCTESIRCDGTLSNPYFLRCQFETLKTEENSSISRAMFINCKITRDCYMAGVGSFQFINSYVTCYTNNNWEKNNTIFYNCIIAESRTSSGNGGLSHAQVLNSIIYQQANGGYDSWLDPSVMMTNCVAINYPGLFDSSTSSTNCREASFAEVFKDFMGDYSDTQTFELTNTAKTTFLGTDGKEVGLYGGVQPYTSVPSYPQITKMNVANQTTADGKLSVDIEVSAME